MIIALERNSDGDFLPQSVQGDTQCLQPIQPTVEEDITPILPFKHKGHLISVVNNVYKCPWCLHIFGNKQRELRRHLSSPTGVCHRNKVSNDFPQCVVCLSHFSSPTSLFRHTKTFGGSCTKRRSVRDRDKVDFLKPGECLFVYHIVYTYIILGNTYPAMISITDDWGIKVFIGFSNSFKNLIGTFYR